MQNAIAIIKNQLSEAQQYVATWQKVVQELNVVLDALQHDELPPAPDPEPELLNTLTDKVPYLTLPPFPKMSGRNQNWGKRAHWGLIKLGGSRTYQEVAQAVWDALPAEEIDDTPYKDLEDSVRTRLREKDSCFGKQTIDGVQYFTAPAVYVPVKRAKAKVLVA